VLAGHSTGCQKIAYFQSRRADPAVEALIHLAPGDDHAILCRDMGREAMKRLTVWASRRVRGGHGNDPIPAGYGVPGFCAGFTARRILSIADPEAVEAQLFHYEGRLRVFSRLALPMLVLFGTREEYACMPLRGMGERLRAATSSRRFAFKSIQGADHGFHGHEAETAEAVFAFLAAPRRGKDAR
jgi:dienelactone hydrolase